MAYFRFFTHFKDKPKYSINYIDTNNFDGIVDNIDKLLAEMFEKLDENGSIDETFVMIMGSGGDSKVSSTTYIARRLYKMFIAK